MTTVEFFAWWRARLGELVPETLRGSWQNAGTSITLKIEGNSLELKAPPADTVVRFKLSTQDDPAEPEPSTGSLSDLPKAPHRIRLIVGPDDYLSRQLTLPRAARGNLAEAVGYQLPQLTPFATGQVLYACGEMPDSPTHGLLSVWLVAVPRQHIVRALALIGEVPPTVPLPLRNPPVAGEALELSWRVAEKSSSPRRRLAWLGLAAMWIAVIGLHSHNRQQEQAQLDQTLSEISIRAAEVGQLRDRIAKVRMQAEWLAEHRQTAVSPLALIDALTQQLDDKTWIQGLDLRGQRLSLRGISESPATLIGTLEATALLKDVRFDAATTRDGSGQGDRFNISAQLEAPAQDSGT